MKKNIFFVTVVILALLGLYEVVLSLPVANQQEIIAKACGTPYNSCFPTLVEKTIDGYELFSSWCTDIPIVHLDNKGNRKCESGSMWDHGQGNCSLVSKIIENLPGKIVAKCEDRPFTCKYMADFIPYLKSRDQFNEDNFIDEYVTCLNYWIYTTKDSSNCDSINATKISSDLKLDISDKNVIKRINADRESCKEEYNR